MRPVITGAATGNASAGSVGILLSPAAYFASPSGSDTGAGTSGSPWSLAAALAGGYPSDTIRPGDTIWLRGGTYTGAHRAVSVSGEAGNLVVFRSYPGEWAELDGGANAATDVVSWECAHVALRDLTVCSSATDRTADTDDSYASFNSPHTGVQNSQVAHSPGYGTGCKLINCILKNLGGGVSTWSNGIDTEIYGCNIFYHGWCGPTHAWGVGWYSQNIAPSGRLFRDNLVWGNHEYAVQAYGESALLDNHDCQGNIIFADGAIRALGTGGAVTIGGGTAPPTGNIWKSNAVYGAENHGVVTFERGCESLDCRDNLHGYAGTNGGELNLTGQTGTPVVTGNKVYSGLIQPAGYDTTWPSNEWHRWSQDYGGPDSKPTGEWTLVRPNLYEPGRGHVAIFNWDHHDTVDVNVADILASGDGYAVYHAMDPRGTPAATGTFGGSTITFPMTGLTVEAPVNASTPSSCGPEFAAFIVVRT